MSYPEPRYTGETGEVSATFRRAGEPAELPYRSGNAVSYLATGATTDGRFGLYRWDFSPQPSGPAPHFHRTISESFFILSGTVRLYDGKQWVDATAGDFSYVPEGGIHAFRNESGLAASMLILFAPGAPREEYFETLARLAGNPSADAERREVALRHDKSGSDDCQMLRPPSARRRASRPPASCRSTPVGDLLPGGFAGVQLTSLACNVYIACRGRGRIGGHRIRVSPVARADRLRGVPGGRPAPRGLAEHRARREPHPGARSAATAGERRPGSGLRPGRHRHRDVDAGSAARPCRQGSA